ncbi:MAG: hypothetical protein M1839_006374, partial [Geoglossum umbratile]
MSDSSTLAASFPAAEPLLEAPPNASILQPQLDKLMYDSIDELMNTLNAWGRQFSLGFVKKQASNKVNNEYTRYSIICD